MNVTTIAYPTKVQRVVNRIHRSRDWAGLPVEVRERDGLWVIEVEKPGNVFLAESLRVFVAVHAARTIPGTDIRLRASQRMQGGWLHRFGGHRELKTWRDVEAVTYPDYTR